MTDTMISQNTELSSWDILYYDNQKFVRNLWKFDYTPGSMQAITELHPYPPRDAGPVSHVMFHKN
jgi:hypothetical protein